MMDLFRRIKRWWTQRRCYHVFRYKETKTEGYRRVMYYECPLCGKVFVQRL